MKRGLGDESRVMNVSQASGKGMDKAEDGDGVSTVFQRIAHFQLNKRLSMINQQTAHTEVGSSKHRAGLKTPRQQLRHISENIANYRLDNSV